MKQQLLLWLALCFPLSIFAQATAYPVPDINQCGNNVFNLNQQTPLVLNGQGPFPGQFEVFYYTSLAGAQTGSAEGYLTSAVAANYTLVGQNQIIYIRVQNAIGNAWDVTSFQISNNNLPGIFSMPDLVVCGPFILPNPIPGTGYYSGPNGTNPPVENPNFYTLYIFADNGQCTNESSFTVTVVPPGPYPTQDVSACSSYVLPNTMDVFYYGDPEGTGTNYPVGTEITTSMTMYVIPATPNSCFEVNSFDIHIGNPEVTQPTTPLYGCNTEVSGFSTFDFQTKFFEITTATGNTFSVHASLADAQNNQDPIDYGQPVNVASPQTVYVRVSNGGSCSSIVTLNLIPELCTQNIVYGEIHYDAANNGCLDSYTLGANVEVVRTDGVHTVSTYADIYGTYYFQNVPQGESTITVVPPTNFAANPTTQSIASSGTMNWYDAQPVCLSATNSVSDIDVTLVPYGTPRPQDPLTYNIYVKNLGTTTVSGTVVFQYDSTKLDLANAGGFSFTAPNTLTKSISDFHPLQIWGGGIEFTVKSQPQVTIGDQLFFTANVSSVPADGNLGNNTATIAQTVVNSFDPNDIVVHEGAFIEQDQADDYLHYTIRFQNEGTAEAEDIRIENRLSSHLDWTTFEPIAASTDLMRIERIGDEVTFTFDGIDLPPNPTNDPDLVGFVSYKIKPMPGFAIGDVISNDAAIYFDDNAPIMTNTVTTQIAPLGIAENALETLKIYPNPSSELVYLSLDSVSEKVNVQVLDMQGKVILDANQQLIDSRTSIDVAKIQSGIYFLKVAVDGKSTVKKWVKL